MYYCDRSSVGMDFISYTVLLLWNFEIINFGKMVLSRYCWLCINDVNLNLY